MLKWLGGLIDSNEKELKRLQPVIHIINELEPEFERLTDEELKAKTAELKGRLNEGSSLDELLPLAHKYGYSHTVILGIILGMFIMALSLLMV